MVVCTCSGEDFQLAVSAAEFLEMLANLLLRHGLRQVIFFRIDELRWYITVKPVQGGESHPVEHLFYIFLCMRKIRKFFHGLFTNHVPVSFCIHEFVELCRIPHLNLDNPVSIRVFIHKFRRIFQSIVALQDSAADRAEEVT